MTEALCAGASGPACCAAHPSCVRANSTRRLSPSTAARNAASACGMTETGRSVLGWGWLGWAGLGWGLWKPGTARPGPPANCPSAWPYSTLITEPCPAHHLGPVPARDQRHRGTRCCSPCCFYKPVNPLRSASDRPALSAQPLPLPPEHMSSAALCAAKEPDASTPCCPEV